VRELHGDADAVDGRGETTEEELLLGLGEDLVEARADGALGGSVAGPVDVGGVLQQTEDALLPRFGEGVWRSEGLGVGGERSILKSPVWTIVPMGV